MIYLTLSCFWVECCWSKRVFVTVNNISEGIAGIVVLGKQLYHTLLRAALGRDLDAQALLQKTSILMAT